MVLIKGHPVLTVLRSHHPAPYFDHASNSVSSNISSAPIPHFRFAAVVQFACYFVIYLFMVFIFAGVVVALEYRTDGTCGLEGFESIKNISYYELAYELSWSTVSYCFSFAFLSLASFHGPTSRTLVFFQFFSSQQWGLAKFTPVAVANVGACVFLVLYLPLSACCLTVFPRPLLSPNSNES